MRTIGRNLVTTVLVIAFAGASHVCVCLATMAAAPSAAAADEHASGRAVRGSSLMMCGRVIALGLNFGTQIIVVRYLSKDDFGAFAYVLALVMLFKSIALFGMPDTLAERGKNKELDKDVRRRYSKYVKAVFQAGDERSDSYKTPLGYPVEIIPRRNPYSLKAGQTLEVLCVKDGRPLVNQFVSAGRELNGRELTLPSVRSDNNGIARIPLKGAGKWYVKFIQMTKLDDPQLNYESKWATLTFEVK